MFTAILLSALLGLEPQVPARRVPAVAPLKPRLLEIITNEQVTPGTITFSATDPDGTPTVTGSASAVVSWTASISLFGALGPWKLEVSAPSTFSSCSTIPVSAVTVSCTAITGGASPTCFSGTLATTNVKVASGSESLLVGNYSVTLSFTLADSWKYIASSLCSLTVTYTITAG